tara:strand:- start:264 stop:410 length:147 start_codon:yes stop_codon:yes gene_type:complete
MDGRKLPINYAYQDNTSASLATPRRMGRNADVFNTSLTLNLAAKQAKK